MADEVRLALLIDADNASAKNLDAILVEVAKHGRASIRRAYGDWTSTRLAGWKDPLLHHSVQPVQQFAYTTGKNATDSAMIIDAMDLLHTSALGGFCLVSSDSDFTRLATRIREQGLVVYGIGERKTPKAFVSACDLFIYVENLGQTTTKPAPVTKKFQPPTELNRLLSEAFDAAVGDDGWAHLGALGSNLSRLASDFDTRTWGFAKLKDLMSAHPDYQLNSQKLATKSGPVMVKRTAKAKRPAGSSSPNKAQPASTRPIS